MQCLTNTAIEIAMTLIAKHGDHIPFALVVDVNGTRTNVAADNTEVHDGTILGQTVLQELKSMVSTGHLRAIAFARNIEYLSAIDCSHVDAIEVTLDHVADEPVTCILPYKIMAGEPKPGELFAIEPREQFFRRP